MKKVLYGTTALVAAGMLSTGAMAAEKIKMGVGGYMAVFGAISSQDDGVGQPGAMLREHTMVKEAEIIFNGSTKLDNGIQVGVQVQLEAETCGDQIDESFAWFSGAFGRINIGAENSAPYLMAYASSANPHWGVNSPNISHAASGTNLAAPGGVVPFVTTQITMTSDSDKITYFTPRMAGFQLGASYTPDDTEDGSSYGGFEPETSTSGTHDSEAVEIGANYVGKIGQVGLALSAGYGHSNVEVNTATNKDHTQWNVGGRVTVAGFTIGGAYRFDNLGTDGAAARSNEQTWNGGIRYASGPWSIGIQYTHAETEFSAAAGGGEDTIDAFEIGGAYTLGPGVSLVAGVQFWNIDGTATVPGRTAASASNDATIFYLGTALSF